MTTAILRAIEQHATTTPDANAVIGSEITLSYATLYEQITRFSLQLTGSCLGILMDNSPAWLVADLAAMKEQLTCVPLPPFFSRQQLKHAITDAQIDTLLCDDPTPLLPLLDADVSITPCLIAGQTLQLIELKKPGQRQKDIAKITYTSGTSGTSKGVCLSATAIDTVTASLCIASEANQNDVSLALLPLAVLLENIGSGYAPLTMGARCVLLSMDDIGIHGATNINTAKLRQSIKHYRPTTLILMPQLLQVLLALTNNDASLSKSFRFIAVGGAPISKVLLQHAHATGLPVFQGYGLSEATSVISLNTATENRIGSVGKVLPHASVKFSPENEILVRGACYKGYLGDKTVPADDWLATGDMGYIDRDGYLFISGRKKSIFITALGRNVAPEWVEGELQNHSAIAQSAVFGEGKPYNIAIIVPGMMGDKTPDQHDLDTAVLLANEQLPEYARIKYYYVSNTPFSLANGQYTATGRPKRDSIANAYQNEINNLFRESA